MKNQLRKIGLFLSLFSFSVFGVQAPSFSVFTSPGEPLVLTTRPCNDFDLDGMPDDYERQYFGSLDEGPDGDFEQDSLTNLQEFKLGTDPTDRDSENDGLEDGWEFLHNLDPLSVTEFQDAVNAVENGEHITILPGTYTLSSSLSFSGKAISLSSTDPSDRSTVASTVLQGDGTFPLITFSANETLDSKLLGLTLQNGSSGILISNASPFVSSCIIQSNTATGNGGGISCTSSNAKLYGNEIIGNTAAAGAGFYSDGGTVELFHNVIAGNTASTGNGAGIYASGSVSFSFNTVSDNTAAGNGGGLFVASTGTVSIDHSIFHGNTAATGAQLSVETGGSVSVDFSNMQGGETAVDGTVNWGTENIDTDPLFAGGGDYHLQSQAGRYLNGIWVVTDSATSPCIDKGNPELINLSETSPNGDRCNIGAYANTPQASRSFIQPDNLEIVAYPESVSILEGKPASFSVRLNACPVTPVVVDIALTGAVTAEFRNPSDQSLTFTSADWNVPRMIILDGNGDISTTNTASIDLSATDVANVSIPLTEIDKDASYSGFAPVVIPATWPMNGELVAPENGSVLITLFFEDVSESLDYNAISVIDTSGGGNIDITAEVLISGGWMQWRLNNLSDGLHTFEITWGTLGTTQYAFLVDATSPVTTASPNGGIFSDPVMVQLHSSEHATIHYSSDGYPPFEGAENTTSATAPITDITISETTNLMFYAVDHAGNLEETQSVLFTFGEPLQTPHNLTAFYNPAISAVELAWSSFSTLAARFNIYRGSGQYEEELLISCAELGAPAPDKLLVGTKSGGQNVSGSFVYPDHSAVPGSFCSYTICALASDGRESPPSEVVTLVVPASSPPPDIDQAMERASAWLINAQSPEGYWQNSEQTRIQDTAQALLALKLSGNESLALRNGYLALRSAPAYNSRFCAQKILTLMNFSSNMRPFAARLQTFAKSDTTDFIGWGLTADVGTDVFSTALSCDALEKATAADSFLTLIKALDTATLFSASGTAELQAPYTWGQGTSQSIFVSSVVYDLLNSPDTDWSWISQNPDDSFGNEVIDTAAVLIHRSGFINTAAVNYLISKQSTSGDWNNDPFVTALCLEALLVQNQQ